MDDNEINDKRVQKDFKQTTFSKFQKVKVKKEFIACLLAGKVEAACYWSAEFICAGHFADLWECIIQYVSKYVHLGNPKLPIYIAMRIENFKAILSNGYIDNELQMRNNSKIRQMFAEIIAILSYSRKKPRFEPIKIKKEEEFHMTHIASRLKAPSVTFAQSAFKKGDPKELYIAMNEFAFHVSGESRNVVSACYWLEWILEFETLSKRKQEICCCERRSFAPVLEKYQMDIIWIVWEILLEECSKQKHPVKQKIMDALLAIYCIKYTSGAKKRRRYIIYFAIALLTEPFHLGIDIMNNKDIIQNIVTKINIVYKDVKKNEVSPETDYLFDGVTNGKSNLEKTIERLDQLNKISGL